MEGFCPVCGHNEDDLEYEAIEINDNLAHYPWKCGNCQSTGSEWYQLEFIGHNVTGQDNTDANDLINHVYTDLLMLQDGTWQPDEKSVEDSINTVEKLAEELKLNLKDTRE